VKRIAAPLAIALAIAASSACSNGSNATPGTPHRRPTYDHAIESVARRQATDDSLAVPGARSILLTNGARTARAILLLHGLTDSPRQFEAFAYLLHADGNNVYVPRLPEHGLRGSDASALGRLSEAQLRGVADSVVSDAHGLGDTVLVVGLSMGGTIAAWIAQERSVGRVVLIAPAIEPGRVPSMLDRPIIGLASRLPSITRRSALDTLRPDREPGFNTRALAEILMLGGEVVADAGRDAPRTHEITVLVNASDRTVKASAAEALAAQWSRRGAAVSVFELPDSLRLPHNIIDATRGRVGGDTVLALLRRLVYGEQPSALVRRLASPGP
jgi:esterase/lipase